MTESILKKFLPCQFTDNAIKEIKNTVTTKNIPQEYGLRVGMQGGGCSGLSFLIGFDKQKETDDVYELAGLKIWIDKKHTMYLINVIIDFEDGVNARGFVFNTPDQN
jgi:iron-sulfur cluster assembly protein